MQELDSFQLQLGQGSEIAMALTLALMMFSVAIGLRREHFRFFITRPRVFYAGVFTQIILLPLLTLGLCFLLNPQPSVALGMILIACCPGGNVSNLLVLLARGNTALSVSLTATSSIAAAFITPVSILFWCSLYPPTNSLLTEINFDALAFLTQTTVILAVPLLAGMVVAELYPVFVKRFQKTLVTIASFGLLAIIVTTLVRYFDQFLTLGLALIGLVAIHNASAFLLGYGSARLIGADSPSARALTFEVGIQNSGLGIVILLTQLGGMGGAAAVAGLWGIWHIVAGLVLVSLFRKLQPA